MTRLAILVAFLFGGGAAVAQSSSTDTPTDASSLSSPNVSAPQNESVKAPPQKVVTPEPKKLRGIFLSDEDRYPKYGFFPGVIIRSLQDLVSIPSNIPNWTSTNWIELAAVVGVSAGLSISWSGPSLDVRAQDVISNILGGKAHPTLWQPYNDFIIWTALWSTTAGIFMYGFVHDQPDYVECSGLMLESFIVTQIYHLAIKLVTGRQGPKDAQGLGYYEGPPGFFKWYPSGTPSGHVSTMFALLSVLFTYFDNPVLDIAIAVAGMTLAAAIVTDNYHFASDVIAGAALGWSVGRFVVDHRSTRYRNGDDNLVHRVLHKVAVGPFVTPYGAEGLAAAIRF